MSCIDFKFAGFFAGFFVCIKAFQFLAWRKGSQNIGKQSLKTPKRRNPRYASNAA